ncbi:RlpA-like double-psi beta-barrel domain protein [Kalmanozyma brasiliensis GHG001]|uniref:Uncharacterized protein n=1 Tax=Kalmanozyma brasiliensis (strain GHG001) TaxID=1365824 RepID=V5ETD5_KALBG|nr:RlpA-like double-psi beta-barrel domain protein [Kalmanozyma brasiliensis GHG001]EST05269.1 RlpA-like double-psi beta-barrel domain protein [Kalmanozyma brasiliensis GHG001]
MRFTTLALFSALVVAAASAQLPSGDVAASSSSSLLLARADAASSSSLINNLTLEKKDDSPAAVADTDADDDDDDDEEEDEEDSTVPLESRGRRHRKHSRHRSSRHRKKHRHAQKHHAKKPHRKGQYTTKDDGTYSGKGTFFKPNQGACGKWNTGADKIVALSADIYDQGDHCFDGVRICHGGKCVNAKVADLCPGCKHTSLDMSPSLFKELADPDVGVIDIQWSFT